MQPEACNFIKKEVSPLEQVFSCEFCDISKNIFLHRIPLVAASEYTAKSYMHADEDKHVQLC